MRYLTNNRNLVRDAVLTALNVIASNVVYRADAAAKQGGGQVTLTGDYTGANDATYDVQIVDNTVEGTPKVSAPSFIGVGNGVMSAPTALDGTAAQRFSVVLEDLGTATVKGYAPFAGITLRAKLAGPSAITLTVDNSALTFTPTVYSLQHDVQSDTNEYTGDEWDFGAAVLNPDLSIPNNAPRLSFGADPQVYRQYKFYRDGRYVYGFSPAPVRAVGAGIAVFAVDGARTVEILNAGVVADTFTDVVSVYDALNAIRAGSSLVDVVGPVVNDNTSGGQAATDLSVWTASYVVSLGNSGGDEIRHSILVVVPSATAPTETLTLTVIDDSKAGQEIWSVIGDVSGRLANAVTGVAYTDGGYRFTIQSAHVDPAVEQGTLNAMFVPVARSDGGTPTMCPTQPVLGSAARAKVLEFVFQKRPAAPCDCDGPMEGGPNPDCLGILPDGGDNVSDESRLIRLQRLTKFVRDFVSSNTPPVPSIAGAGGITTDVIDVDWGNKGAGIFKQCLSQIAAVADSNDPAVWQADHVYAVDNIRQSVNKNGYRFAVTAVTGDKKSHATTEPTWVTTIGANTIDNHVTWTCIGKMPFGMWDDATTQFFAEAQALASLVYGSQAVQVWVASTAMTVGALRPTTAHRNGHLYYNPGSLTTGGSEPTYSVEPRGVVKDGNGIIIELFKYWSASVDVKKGNQVIPGDGFVWIAKNDGTSGSSEPNWFTGNDTISDGSVTYTRTQGGSLNEMPSDEYFQRYQSMCNDILAAAGIDPTFKNAGNTGSNCWQDFGGDSWFVYDGTDAIPYLPIQPGHYWHSAKPGVDVDGNQIVVPTHECGFGPKFGCQDDLTEGDKIILIIPDTANSTGGYPQGDSFSAQILHAVPLEFGGGQFGNDTLTFFVSGSVDGTYPAYHLLYGDTPAARTNSHNYAKGDRYTPAVSNGRFYECTVGGISAGSPPTFTTNRTTFADGAATFIDMGDVDDYSENGITFDITKGGIDFELGDKFEFDIEGGHAKSRKNGGTWSSPFPIADTVVLGDGLSIAFAGGVAPSWVATDTWSFIAKAKNGVDNARQPTDARIAWTGSTTITVAPTAPEEIDCMLLADHTIPSDVIIHLQGSDDDFGTVPLNQVVPWTDRHIYIRLPAAATRAKYRVTIDKGGSANWLFIGDGLDPKLPNGVVDLGVLTKRKRMPSLTSRAALGAEVAHTCLSQASAAAINAGISHACQYDDKRLAIVPNDYEPGEIGLVEYATDTLEFTDARQGFQPRDPAQRLIAVTLTFNPVA